MTDDLEKYFRREIDAQRDYAASLAIPANDFFQYLSRSYLASRSLHCVDDLAEGRADLVCVLGGGPSTDLFTRTHASSKAGSICAAPRLAEHLGAGERIDFAVVGPAPGPTRLPEGTTAIIDPLRAPRLDDVAHLRRAVVTCRRDGSCLPSWGYNALLAIHTALCLRPGIIVCLGFDALLAGAADPALALLRAKIAALHAVTPTPIVVVGIDHSGASGSAPDIRVMPPAEFESLVARSRAVDRPLVHGTPSFCEPKPAGWTDELSAALRRAGLSPRAGVESALVEGERRARATLLEGIS